MSGNDESILTSTKKMLGIDEAYQAFDLDILININSVFSTLQQLGVGPPFGFMVDDATATWADYIGANVAWNAVKTYVYLRVKLVFDPPATGFTLNAYERQITELEWRLTVSASSSDILVGAAPAIGKPSIWNLTGLTDFPAEAPINAVGIDFITRQIYQKTA